MERLKATDFPPEVLKLFDGYVHGWLSRRDFLDKAGKYAVGGFTATAMLESLRPNYAFAQQIPKNDPRIATEYAHVSVAAGLGHDEGLPRPAGRRGQVARRRGDPREPRPQSVHRGCRATARGGRFRRLRAGCAHAARRLSRRRGKGGADVRHARRRQARRRPRRRRRRSSSRVPNARARSAPSASASAAAIVNQMAVRFPDLAAGGAVLRRAAERRRRRQDQGAAAASTTRATTSASTPAGPPTRPRSRRTTSSTRRSSTRTPTTASTTTPRRATTRPRPSSRGRARSPSSRKT